MSTPARRRLMRDFKRWDFMNFFNKGTERKKKSIAIKRNHILKLIIVYNWVTTSILQNYSLYYCDLSVGLASWSSKKPWIIAKWAMFMRNLCVVRRSRPSCFINCVSRCFETRRDSSIIFRWKTRIPIANLSFVYT